MVDLVIYNDPDKSKIGYLMQSRAEIDRQLPGLIWRPKESYKESAIELRKNGPDPSNRDDWANQHQWLFDTLHAFHRLFSPIVRQLPQQRLVGGESAVALEQLSN